MRRTPRFPLIAAVVFWTLTVTTQASPPPPSRGAEILAGCGVRGGLVVHLGCGQGKLTADLATGESYLVHGLDTRAANVRQAREYIRTKGLGTRASADTFAADESDDETLGVEDELAQLKRKLKN